VLHSTFLKRIYKGVGRLRIKDALPSNDKMGGVLYSTFLLSNQSTLLIKKQCVGRGETF
jgi:hypothetical protein